MNNSAKRVRRLSDGMKASIAFFLASVITKGIAYITTPIYTRLLTSEEFGSTSLFLTWLNVLGIVAMFNLQAGVFNNGMIDYPDRRDDYSFSMLILSNIITVIFSFIILVFYSPLKGILQLNFSFVVLMCFVFLLQPAYNFWVSRQRYEYKYKWTVFWSVITAAISPFVAILLINKTSFNHLYSRIFGAEVPLLLIYIGFYIYLGRNNNWKLNTQYWKKAILFNLPLIPHYLSLYLLGSSDKIMISSIISKSATAYYSVAYSIASVATIIWSAANGSLIPYTYQKCKEKQYRAISDVTIPILTLFACACIGVVMLAPEVVHIMATSEYHEAVYVIPPVVAGVFFQVQYFIYSNIVYYYKKPRYVMYASVISMLTNIVLNYIFIPIYGYIAAGYTTLFCYALQAALDYCAMRKVLSNKIYDMKYIILLSVTVVAIGVFSSFIYNKILIRYSIVLILLLIFAIFRNRIFAMIRPGKQEED